MWIYQRAAEHFLNLIFTAQICPNNWWVDQQLKFNNKLVDRKGGGKLQLKLGLCVAFSCALYFMLPIKKINSICYNLEHSRKLEYFQQHKWQKSEMSQSGHFQLTGIRACDWTQLVNTAYDFISPKRASSSNF